MSDINWLSIKYGEFYDIPRVFVVNYEGETYFFDCPFKDELDDYPDFFTVYRVPEEEIDKVETISWSDISTFARPIGIVKVKDVQFDETKRKFIADRVFEMVANKNNGPES